MMIAIYHMPVWIGIGISIGIGIIIGKISSSVLSIKSIVMCVHLYYKVQTRDAMIVMT